MRRFSVMGLGLAALLGAALVAPAPARAEEAREKAERFVRDFQARRDVAEAAKKAALELFSRETPVAAREAARFIEACLEGVSPDFQKGQAALRGNDADAARAAFSAAARSDDPWLKAHALYGAAMADFRAKRFPEAEEGFSQVAEKHAGNTPRDAEASFYRALAAYEQALHVTPDKEQALKDRALQSFRKFLEEHGDAPERLTASARQAVEDLQKAFTENRMQKVTVNLRDAEKLLREENTGDPTQTRQKAAVGTLEELIQEIEQQQQQQGDQSQSQDKSSQCPKCKGKGCRKCGGSGKKSGSGSGQGRGGPPSGTRSTGPAAKTGAQPPAGPSRIGELSPGRAGANVFAPSLPPKDREAVQNSLREKFPPRYMELLEQYYLGISEVEKKRP